MKFTNIKSDQGNLKYSAPPRKLVFVFQKGKKSFLWVSCLLVFSLNYTLWSRLILHPFVAGLVDVTSCISDIKNLRQFLAFILHANSCWCVPLKSSLSFECSPAKRRYVSAEPELWCPQCSLPPRCHCPDYSGEAWNLQMVTCYICSRRTPKWS
jgi:hypothetical protein